MSYSGFWLGLKVVFYWILDVSVHLWPRYHIFKPTRSLLILRLDSIGDFVLWLDTARHLRNLYPPSEWNITLVVNQEWESLAKAMQYWDVVIPQNRKLFLSNPCYRLRFLRRIYKSKYDVVINPIFSTTLLLADSVVRASSAPVRIGWDINNHENAWPYLSLRQWISNPWYTQRIYMIRGHQHEIERNSHFISSLSNRKLQPRVSSIHIKKPKPPFGLPEVFFVVVPDAQQELREWPLEHFWDLARHVTEHTQWTPVFMGIRPTLARKIDSMIDGSTVINLIGRTNLLEFVATLKRAKLVIGNDSSAIHIASALNIPSIAIAGGGHWKRFIPYPPYIPGMKPLIINESMNCYGCDWRCIFPPQRSFPCIARVSVENAIMALNSFFNTQM